MAYWHGAYWHGQYWHSAYWHGTSDSDSLFQDPRTAGGGGGVRGKKRKIPPVMMADKKQYFPHSWEEFNQIMNSFQVKRGRNPDDEAEEDRLRQEEEAAIVKILRKAYGVKDG